VNFSGPEKSAENIHWCLLSDRPKSLEVLKLVYCIVICFMFSQLVTFNGDIDNTKI